MSQKPQFVPITKIMNHTGNLIHFQMDDLNHILLSLEFQDQFQEK